MQSAAIWAQVALPPRVRTCLIMFRRPRPLADATAPQRSNLRASGRVANLRAKGRARVKTAPLTRSGAWKRAQRDAQRRDILRVILIGAGCGRCGSSCLASLNMCGVARGCLCLFALSVRFLNVSLSACGVERAVAYALAVRFLSVSLSVCGVACAVSSALVVCVLHASSSAGGFEHTAAYALAVCFLNVSLSVCGVACAVASALVARSLNVSLNIRGVARSVAVATAPPLHRRFPSV